MTQAQRDAAYAEEDRDRESATKHAEWVREHQRKKLKRNPAKCAHQHVGTTDDPKRYKCMDCGATVKRNPASASAEVYEDFHGFPPKEIVTVSKQIHHHAHLASLGELVQLDVWGVDGRGIRSAGSKVRCWRATKRGISCSSKAAIRP